METQEHPTHHRRPLVLCRVCGVLALIAAFATSALVPKFKQFPLMDVVIPLAAFMLVFFVPVVLFGARLARSCNCPRCGAILGRDNRAPSHEFHYPCQSCEVTWVSRLRVPDG
jgi:hypothetical protein